MYNLYIVKITPSYLQTLARTQVYLTEAQQNSLAAASRRGSVTKSELIRRAVDQFLDAQKALSPLPQKGRLQGISGLWAQREDMADPGLYVRVLRASRFKPEA